MHTFYVGKKAPHSPVSQHTVTAQHIVGLWAVQGQAHATAQIKGTELFQEGSVFTRLGDTSATSGNSIKRAMSARGSSHCEVLHSGAVI